MQNILERLEATMEYHAEDFCMSLIEFYEKHGRLTPKQLDAFERIEDIADEKREQSFHNDPESMMGGILD